MSKRDPLPAMDAAPVTADEAEVLATEYLLNHPRAALLLKIAAATLAVVVIGGADFLAVFHIMALKFVDPMGQPVGDTAGLAAMSGVTLVAYVLLGALWARPERAAKAAALALYAVILVLLGTAIAPAEISNIREVWASVAGSAGFGSNTAEDAPAWFVVPCLVVLAVAFSLFGLLLIRAKNELSRLLALYQLRTRAKATLDHAAATRAQAEARQKLAAFIAALETPATATALRHAAVRRGLDAYRTGVEAQAAALKAALADVCAPKAEKQHLAALFAEAGACLNSIPTNF